MNTEGEAFKIHIGRAAVIPAGSSSDSGRGLIWRKGEGRKESAAGSAAEVSLCQDMCAVAAPSEEEPGNGEGCTGSQAGWVYPHRATRAALPVTILQEDCASLWIFPWNRCKPEARKQTGLHLWATG